MGSRRSTCQPTDICKRSKITPVAVNMTRCSDKSDLRQYEWLFEAEKQALSKALSPLLYITGWGRQTCSISDVTDLSIVMKWHCNAVNYHSVNWSTSIGHIMTLSPCKRSASKERGCVTEATRLKTEQAFLGNQLFYGV